MVGAADPVGQRRVQRDFKARLAQFGIVAVGQLQPALLGLHPRNAKVVAAIAGKAHIAQVNDGFQFGLRVALQQPSALLVLNQHGGTLVDYALAHGGWRVLVL